MSNLSLIDDLKRTIAVSDAELCALELRVEAMRERIADLEAGMLQVRQVSRHLLYGGV